MDPIRKLRQLAAVEARDEQLVDLVHKLRRLVKAEALGERRWTRSGARCVVSLRLSPR